MSKAHLVVTAVRVEQRPIAEVARNYGLSRQWIHTLLRRYDLEGVAGLQPRDRTPRTNPNRTPSDVEDRIVELRKDLHDAGLDAGAHTIAWHLTNEGHDHVPSVSTIWRILQRRGFITPQPQKRPRSSLTRFEADQPNELWQADTTHWHLADGTDIEICNIIDDHSRLLVSSQCRTRFKAVDVVDVFIDAMTIWGLPAAVLTDNGAIFTAKQRGKGQVALERHLTTLGIRIVHSRPYHPQTCGKVERFHQTLKKRLAACDPAHNLRELQAQLDTFADLYNQHRPHRAIARRTPHHAWHDRPRATPNGPLDLTHHRIRRDIINNGTVTLRHNSRLHHIGIGKRHTGTPVIVLVADRHIRVITRDGTLLRELTLDPTRNYQPTGLPPGPSPKPPNTQ